MLAGDEFSPLPPSFPSFLCFFGAQIATTTLMTHDNGEESSMLLLPPLLKTPC
jgi:hypothetical protein